MKMKRKRLPSDFKRRCIKVKKMSGFDSSGTSTDSVTRKKISAERIQFMHNYNTSPRKMKTKYISLRELQAKSRRKLYTAKRAIKTLRRKIISMAVVVEDLKKNLSLSEGAAFQLEKCYEDVPNVLIRRYLKNINIDTTSRE